jgi:hypothetical protein
VTDINHVDPPDVQYEPSDVNIRGVLAFGLGLIVVAVALHFGIWLLFQAFAARETVRVAPEYPLAAGQENRLPPEPRLQTNPRQDLKDLRAAEDDVLNQYGWVDKNAGVVRIPIDEAMKLVLRKGLPVRSSKQP